MSGKQHFSWSNGRVLSLVVANEPAPHPEPSTRSGLRHAAAMVEGMAYDMAGKESAAFVSRLIEIAAELDRASRDDCDIHGRPALSVCAAE